MRSAVLLWALVAVAVLCVQFQPPRQQFDRVILARCRFFLLDAMLEAASGKDAAIDVLPPFGILNTPVRHRSSIAGRAYLFTALRAFAYCILKFNRTFKFCAAKWTHKHKVGGLICNMRSNR